LLLLYERELGLTPWTVTALFITRPENRGALSGAFYAVAYAGMTMPLQHQPAPRTT
jgi:hypothetical protein